MVMAGGGFRFGYYLGMHAAAEELERAPDIILAACGGAIAAAAIHGLPDTDTRRDWLCAPELYTFQRNIRSLPPANAKLTVTGTVNRVWRQWTQQAAHRAAPDLLRDAMFELPALPVIPTARSGGTDIAIIAARVSTHASMSHWPYQLHETVFAPNRVAGLLANRASWAKPFLKSAIAPALECNTTVAIEHAVRASVADPFYFASVHAEGQDWSGGLVDLFPIEIAHALADHVVMERKRKFNPLYAQPAVRAVYGVNGNARRRAVQDNTHADVWVDTTDVSRVLRHETERKQYDRATGQIVLRAAPTHSEFVRQMTAQWHYGRERTLRAFEAANKRKT
ncbi:hypothetical protein G7069_06530 [Lysobacter sp. HDW10]|uniref:patatin-like phospholipase family protein n=1 Tax=Lysobacter sp. HDW10 TaxID=2714936 RepID=UPI001409D736|nr:patatin-like phospholipase family protein [Lysobacter sp. HDW10]QIK81283.1 hypothetical protein G7069_06530 [Lysobacter sp. HDW10]